ncbi:hypothetical protein QOZ80_8BG0656840 [Eleusine coracana subsp. coracana]|nr:hypothetical protein QOZ80_8BG0656840 [Eleusine coracana subsp. coracana]
MSTTLAMFDHYDEEPLPEVAADPSCSRNIIDDNDDWVIVKKQRITISIPPPSPDAANPQADMPKICTEHCSEDAARKKHPEQLTAKKSQDSPLEDGSRKKALENHAESIVHKGIPKMTLEISSHSPAAPVVKSELTKGIGKAAQGLFYPGTGKVTSSTRSMDKSRMPVVSSHVANKIMRARILERRVAGLGGLKNWLFDCGLGWFIDVLDSEKLGMYQLVSLTMNQLKEMGLVAVGPRRKLIHAIDSLSRPHPFEMVS